MDVIRRRKVEREALWRKEALEVDRYCRLVKQKRIIAGPYVRQACARHMRDITEKARKGLRWDKIAAGRAIRFFEECLTFPDGPTAGQPFALALWQKFIVGSLFGWVRKEDGARRYQEAYIETGKGSGKSPLLAGIGLYMLVADKEHSAECYFGAVSREQAKISFRDASRMAEESPILSTALGISGQNIAHVPSGSFMRPISSEGRSLDGKRVHFCGLDELHEHPTAVVYEKMKLNTKGRKQPLIAMITNSGKSRDTVCAAHHEYSKRVLSGAYEDDHWFAYVCALDEKDEPFNDESCWVKANPNLGTSIQPDYVRQQVQQAKGSTQGGFANTVKRLNFCIWTEGAETWINHDAWMACLAEHVVDNLEELPCVAALDLGESRDLTALALAFLLPDNRVFVRMFFWLPGDTLATREDEEKAPYLTWKEQGHFRTFAGAVVDDGIMARDIKEICGTYNVRALAYDRWRTKTLKLKLEAHGMRIYHKEAGMDLQEAMVASAGLTMMVDFGQGFRDMGPAVEAAEKAIFAERLLHDGNPVQTMCVANAQPIEDDAGNRKLRKPSGRQKARIDGAVAMCMALGLLDQLQAAGLIYRSVYEDSDVLIL